MFDLQTPRRSRSPIVRFWRCGNVRFFDDDDDDDVLVQLNCGRGDDVMTTVGPFPVRLILIVQASPAFRGQASGQQRGMRVCAVKG
jgi:hypothetical protein